MYRVGEMRRIQMIKEPFMGACRLRLTNRISQHIIKKVLSTTLAYGFSGKYIIGNDEDEVLRALLNREQTDQLQPSPKSLFYELTSELFP
jgi:hypothetical protein